MNRFLLVFVPPALLALAAALGGWAALLPIFVLFIAVPALDQVTAQDHDNPPGARWMRALPLAFVPAHLAALAYALARITSGELAIIEQIGLVVAAGIATSTAINVAHELMHRADRTEQAVAAVVMATATYTHFCIEHVQGHHKHVGTPRDPATSREGESLYAFLPRTLIGGVRSAWAIEAARSGVGTQNRMLRYGAAQVALLVGIGAVWGGVGVAAFLAQSAIAVLMLETINYIEHYGLVRAETAPGRYERVQPRHSWNSSHRVSNAMLLNLARHSDHHAFAARAFPELRHYDDVPQLPGGYSAMLMLATVPPLWFRVMAPRLAGARAA